MDIIKVVNSIFSFYWMLLILRIFLTWIPNINWYNQPFKSLKEVSDLYLDIFRKIVPPMGGLDFSPIIALIVLQILQGVITMMLSAVLSR